MSEVVLIASSFVRQYYTLLNKAPCFIHNFYSHDSTFIHGTIEMANDHHTEPVVGREKIKRKMEDLKLNDCRAKIKQIDCLETIGGGLVIQVIGELSNNGGPMRRFLQTFVLAPSHDEIRHEGQDSQHRPGGDSRRSVHINENSSSTTHNQKFFVLNSIFRYQDDGPDADYEDEPASVQADASTDSAKQALNHSEAKDAAPPANNVVTTAPPQNKPQQQLQQQQQSGPHGDTKPIAPKVVHNGSGVTPDRRADVTEKSENNKPDAQPSSTDATPSAPLSTPASQQSPSTPTVLVAPKPQPSNEPKTWANMVRNAHPPPPASSQATTNVTKPNSTDQSQSQASSTHHNQSQQQSSSQQQQQQQQPQSDQQAQQNSQNNNNGRRRNMIRKTANKVPGSRLRNRPRPR